ncbi:MAG: nitroreductase family protein [Eubacteriaceae bacterium]|jgi:nitroreductase|nr:nitroreductase family protein [Eubacteriaceae bacterium]
MTIKEIAKMSRSYRGYNEDRKVSEAELLDFIDTARYCPSSINIQPFCYYPVWDEEETARVQKMTNWARSLSMQLPHKGMCPTAFIVICQDTNIFKTYHDFRRTSA